MNDLYTLQGECISENPWQAYPRPLMKRESYVNLNGLWDFAVTGSMINRFWCPFARKAS